MILTSSFCDMNLKIIIYKISVDSNFTYSSYAWLYVFHCSYRLRCWSLVNETFCENCSHFILKWFQPDFFGEMCFLEESYKKMPKNSHFESAFYLKSASMPLTTIKQDLNFSLSFETSMWIFSWIFCSHSDPLIIYS